MNEKRLTLYTYVREETNRVWKTIGKSLYSLFVAKFLSISFITKCLPFLLRTGLRPGDPCVNQSLAITHKIYKSFDEGFEVRGVFVDISKTFSKVWHENLLLKLNQNGISRNLLKLLLNFLPCRKQQVVLNSQHSSRDFFTAGLPQGSVLGSLLFLIYINDLSSDLSPNLLPMIRLFFP